MVVLAAAAVLASAPFLLDPHALWEAWARSRFVTVPAPCLRHEGVQGEIERLRARHGGRIAVETVGESVEGRPIRLLTVGTGRHRVLLWSQMHGDEPSATPALLDVADVLLSGAGPPGTSEVLGAVTLLLVPMLNPDGAERYERRNAQGIDVNRDALNLATAEGRLLKALRDRFDPELGVNLHDQNRRTTVGDTGVLASVSLLAVAGDPAGTMTPGRARAKRVAAAIATALRPLIPGGVARYDEEWSPRAFGDNLTAWGTPVVLIESGGVPPGRRVEDLTRLNFVALMTALGELARDDLAGHDPEIYDRLPRNTTGARVDVAVRGGRILQPGAGAAYRADLAFDLADDDKQAAGCGASRDGSRIAELGDARFLHAGLALDASELVMLPGWVVSVDGLAAKTWLDAEALGNLTRLGVSDVIWRTQAADRPAAAAHARALGGFAAPRITLADEDGARALLQGPPKRARSSRLGDVLAAILGRPAEGPEVLDLVRRLASHPSRLGPRLAPGEPASFLLVRPESQDRLDADARLEAVWLDGRQVWPQAS
jgi:hypothetical protein